MDIINEKVVKEYFDYLKSEEATIVFIVKNLVANLDTKRKWIDVVDFDSPGTRGNKVQFNYIIVELFERKIYPKYPQNFDLKFKKAITWKTSHEDISQQRSKGIRGQMFLFICDLYNKNKGKKEIQLFHNWNQEYGGFDFTGKVPTTTIEREVSMKPNWEYRIIGSRKINDNEFRYIKANYSRIMEQIFKKKRVMLEYFFENSIEKRKS